MTDLLKGNFQPKKRVTASQEPEDLSSQFEREALRRLGGSIAFVSKKKFIYGGEGASADGDRKRRDDS